MIINRWGKYRALADFADVKVGEVIDVTGVLCGISQVMWLCRSLVSDWTNWDLPVEPVENQPHFDVSKQRVPFSTVKLQMREESLKELTSDVRAGKPTALAVIRSLRKHAAAGEQGAIEALAELQGVHTSLSSPSPLTDNRKPITDHPKCLSCPYASGWDSVGTAYCSQPLGIATLFDTITKFPVTDEQYCSHHPEAKTVPCPPPSEENSKSTER
jgi:hypothetical protein